MFFIFQEAKPGEDWLKAFMERWNLSVKLPSTLEKARKIATSDPNIIYGFYDLVQQQYDILGISNRPECIWNVDETNLYIDPQKSRVVAPRGQKASRTTATSGREAITVMAGISAAGDKLPPLIIFKGETEFISYKLLQ